MEARGDTRFVCLPGADALKSAEYFNSRDNIGKKIVHPYTGEGAHWRYLDHPVFDEYLQMPKVIVDSDGARALIEIGDELSNETMPRFLDAAGWAYAEAGLALSEGSTVRRIQLVKEAEHAWHRALVNDLDLGRRYKERWISNEEMSHRLALNLAFVPLMKSIIVGNVTESVRESVLKDTLAIALDAIRSMEESSEAGDLKAVRVQRGFLFEVNALLTLLNMNDARYIPFPSTARADSGYYHPAQTHDISIINQHWGEIRKVIPMEIKSKSSLKDRQRYKALVIRGKMHLVINDYNPGTTVRAFEGLLNGTASKDEIAAIDQISVKMRDMLRLYQQGVTPENLALNSLTRFHDTSKAAEVYPELSTVLRKG